jgi:hypothetical protein
MIKIRETFRKHDFKYNHLKFLFTRSQIHGYCPHVDKETLYHVSSSAAASHQRAKTNSVALHYIETAC